MDQDRSFDEIESRLNSITEIVSDENTPLEEALSLFEEAVKLGLEACEITDAQIVVPEDEEVEGEAGTEPSDHIAVTQDISVEETETSEGAM